MITTSSWFIVANPCSGKRIYRRRIKFLRIALHACKLTGSLRFTRDKGHAVELTQQAVSRGYKQFIVIGGDGTLNEVINGIFSSNCASTEEMIIAAIPSGNGNDWVRQWNITRKTNLTDYFRSGERIWVDVGMITEKAFLEKQGHYFLNAAGLGFDADVVYRESQLRKIVGAHSWTYIISVFLSIFKLRYKELCIETEQEQIKGYVLTSCIGNGCYTGGGLMQTPKANPCDGVFDIMMVQRVRLKDIPSLLNALMKRKIDCHPAVKIIRSDTISVNSLQSVRCETDGVLLNMNFPIEIKLLHHRIQFLIPKISN
jgi:diacylglycerol kinase (ATP)